MYDSGYAAGATQRTAPVRSNVEAVALNRRLLVEVQRGRRHGSVTFVHVKGHRFVTLARLVSQSVLVCRMIVLQSVPQPALLGEREGTRLSVLMLSVALQASLHEPRV